MQKARISQLYPIDKNYQESVLKFRFPGPTPPLPHQIHREGPGNLLRKCSRNIPCSCSKAEYFIVCSPKSRFHRMVIILWSTFPRSDNLGIYGLNDI